MDAGDGLYNRAVQAQIEGIPQPVFLGGGFIYAPKRTMIDVRGGLCEAGKVDQAEATVTIEWAGVTAIYKRAGYSLQGEWICDRVD